LRRQLCFRLSFFLSPLRLHNTTQITLQVFASEM
jgi:hypothetical protein